MRLVETRTEKLGNKKRRDKRTLKKEKERQGEKIRDLKRQGKTDRKDVT